MEQNGHCQWLREASTLADLYYASNRVSPTQIVQWWNNEIMPIATKQNDLTASSSTHLIGSVDIGMMIHQHSCDSCTVGKCCLMKRSITILYNQNTIKLNNCWGTSFSSFMFFSGKKQMTVYPQLLQAAVWVDCQVRSARRQRAHAATLVAIQSLYTAEPPESLGRPSHGLTTSCSRTSIWGTMRQTHIFPSLAYMFLFNIFQFCLCSNSQ